jgi:hypothetical protein
MSISESANQYLIAIGGEIIEVRVTQIAINTWRACAEHKGKSIVQSGRTKEKALAHWKTVAHLGPPAVDENREGRG